jgi:hypothetical protein
MKMSVKGARFRNIESSTKLGPHLTTPDPSSFKIGFCGGGGLARLQNQTTSAWTATQDDDSLGRSSTPRYQASGIYYVTSTSRDWMKFSGKVSKACTAVPYLT